jgi:hypothetical protein
MPSDAGMKPPKRKELNVLKLRPTYQGSKAFRGSTTKKIGNSARG